MFRGTFEQKIDDKGRVNVPVKFREELRGEEGERLFVTNFRIRTVRCLDAYPYSAWLRLEAQLHDRELAPDMIEFFDNFYFPGSQECQIDKQGRLLIPPRLRAYAGLERDVVFTGVMDKFRIWDRDAWQPVFEAGEEIAVSNPRVLSELRIS